LVIKKTPNSCAEIPTAKKKAKAETEEPKLGKECETCCHRVRPPSCVGTGNEWALVGTSLAARIGLSEEDADSGKRAIRLTNVTNCKYVDVRIAGVLDDVLGVDLSTAAFDKICGPKSRRGDWLFRVNAQLLQ
jgi:hypothetical protein